MRDAYIVNLFDCNRKRMDLTKEKGNDSYCNIDPTMVSLYESHNCFLPKNSCNIISSYMVKPTVDIAAKPVNSFFYFKHLWLGKDAKSEVTLPERVASYKGSDK